MRRIVAVILVTSVPYSASAWEVDGFRSGMTLAEAMTVIRSHGKGVLNRFEVRGAVKNTYSLTLKGKVGWDYGYKLMSGELTSGSLTFCSDILYGYDRYLAGGFEGFVTNTERETGRLGNPTLQSFTGASMQISASWSTGNDRLSFGLEKFDGQFYFSQSYEDLSRCPRD